jgi:hypothetical protein
MKNKFVKIENPGYPDYNRIDYIVEETDTQYKCTERKLGKDFKVPGTCLIWRFCTPEEINEHIQDLKTISFLEDNNLIDDIRRMSYIISKEDLCSDGRELWNIVDRCIEEKLNTLNISDRFFYSSHKQYYLATRQDNYQINFNFEKIPGEVYNLIKI